MKSYIYNGYKFTPTIQKKNRIVFFGTEKECSDFIGSREDLIMWPLDDVRLTNKGFIRYGEMICGVTKNDAYFVKMD